MLGGGNGEGKSDSMLVTLDDSSGNDICEGDGERVTVVVLMLRRMGVMTRMLINVDQQKLLRVFVKVVQQ